MSIGTPTVAATGTGLSVAASTATALDSSGSVSVPAGTQLIAVCASNSVAITALKLTTSLGVVVADFTKDAESINSTNVVTSTWSFSQPVGSSGTATHFLLVGGTTTIACAFYFVTGLEVLGPDASSRYSLSIDKLSTGTGSSTAPSSGATATTTQTDVLVIGSIGTKGPVADTAGSWSNSLVGLSRVGTSSATATANATIAGAYLIVTASAGYTAAKTGITSRAWSAAVATYKAASNDGVIKFVQSTSLEGTSVGSLQKAFTATVGQGNLIVVFLRMSTTTQTVTVADTFVNNYSQAATTTNVADGHEIFIYYAVSNASGANTVTATFSASNGHPFMAIYEFSGISPTPLDKAPAGVTGSATPVTTPATGTTAQTNELIFCGIGFAATTGATGTAQLPWLQGEVDTNTSRSASAYRIVSYIGTYSPNEALTGGPSFAWSSLTVSFKSAGPPVGRILDVTQAISRAAYW